MQQRRSYHSAGWTCNQWKTKSVFNPEVSYGTLTDQDSNIYKTFTIGAQTWMAENLRTTRFNDGTSIPHITGRDEWYEISESAYANYNNTTSIDTIATYGRLYNWYAVITGKLAPKGWHVPSEEEWNILTEYLGGAMGAGIKLKESGIIHWNQVINDGSNITGFTALPGGNRGAWFDAMGYFGYWWTSTEMATDVENKTVVVHQVISNYGYDVHSNISHKKVGFSVRCIKD